MPTMALGDEISFIHQMLLLGPAASARDALQRQIEFRLPGWNEREPRFASPPPLSGAD